MRKVRVGGHVVMPIEKCVAVMIARSSGGADAAPAAGRILAAYQAGSI